MFRKFASRNINDIKKKVKNIEKEVDITQDIINELEEDVNELTEPRVDNSLLIKELEDLSINELGNIFRNDNIWLFDQSPIKQGDVSNGSTLYNISKDGVDKKLLTNDFMGNTTNGTTSVEFQKLHWCVPDNSKKLAAGCWVGSGHITLFNDKCEVLDNILVADEKRSIHAAYFTLDTKGVLATDMSKGNLFYIEIDNENKFGEKHNFDIYEWVEDKRENDEWPSVIKPITFFPIDNERGGVTLSCGGYLIVNFENPGNMYVEKYYTPLQMPNAGLLSYYDKFRERLYTNNGVGTGSTSSGFHNALYFFDNIKNDEESDWPMYPNISYRVNYGDSHGIEKVGNYLYIVDRANNSINVVNLNDPLEKKSHIFIPERKLGLDLICKGEMSTNGESNVYVSLRGGIPLSGNNQELNNAVGTEAGLAVFKTSQYGKNIELRYILTIHNNNVVSFYRDDDEGDEINQADCHGIMSISN